MSTLIAVSPARRRKDRLARGLIALATAIAVVPLVLVVFYLLKKGAGALSGSFFTSDPTGNFFGDQGGVRSAIVGSIEIVALAALIAVPLGIGVALYLVEFGKRSKFALAVRYFVDVMTGVPSIVFGLFIYITLVISGFGGQSFTAYKGSFALALLMLPVVARSAEVVLSLVPDALREAALALGAPRWKVTFKVVLPTALPGLITGSMLAIARGMGETAPLLFTAATVNGLTYNLGQRMNSLPAQIFADLSSPNSQLVQRAWGAALVLVAFVFLLTLVARLAQRRSRLS